MKEYKGHTIEEREDYWEVKGPVVNDELPFEFFPTLKDVYYWIDDRIESMKLEGGKE